MKRNQILALAFATVLPTLAMSQSKNDLVGTWKLVSVVSKTDEGGVEANVFGAHPTGFITYNSDGRMSVVIAYDGRKPLSVNDALSAPVEERAQAFSTAIAYAGTYTFTGDKVVHHVEVALNPNFVNTDLTRKVKIQGDRVTLSTPPIAHGGVMQTHELTWERVKSSGPGPKAHATDR
jgi:hypothetical protein